MHMYNNLVRLANSIFGKDFVTDYRNALAEFERNFKSDFNFANGSFEENEDGKFELKFPVGEGADSDSVSVELEDENLLVITYKYGDDHSSVVRTLKETLPEKADPETLYAEVVDGNVVVTVDKVIEPEAPEEEIIDREPTLF